MTFTAPKELRIPLRNLTLAGKAWGDPSHPPMLALHGWLDNAGSFDRLAPILAGISHAASALDRASQLSDIGQTHPSARRHEVSPANVREKGGLPGCYLVAIDLAGHGRSDHRPPGTWYPYIDYLDDLADVIAWFGWSTVDLLGHSLGATLVSVFAAVFPEKVERLLLIEGLGPLATSADKTLEQLRRAHIARAAFRGGNMRVFPTLGDAVEARMRATPLSADAAHCIVERGTKPSGEGSQRAESGDASVGFVWSSDPRLTSPSPLRLTEEQLASVLPGIGAPTLLILAEPNAVYLRREMIDARIKLVGDIEVVRLNGSHHLHLEDAGQVAAAALSFLQRHPVEIR